MRIPTSLTDEFSLGLNKIHSSICGAALRAFKPVIQGQETGMIKLQRGPIEVEKLDLFYSEDIRTYCKELQALLKDWYIENAPIIAPIGGTEANQARRLSIIFSTQINNIKILCAFNIQYLCKKYYRLDRNIKPLQEDLAKVESEISSAKAAMEKRIWSTIKRDLKKRGVPVDDESYITQVSRNENYLEELLLDFMDLSSKYEQLFKQKEIKISKLNKKKERIARKMEEFVIEANVTKPVLLDELGISTRAGGLFVYLDIRNATTGNDLSRDDISNSVAPKIISKFKAIEYGLDKLAAIHKPD
jgi:hypothetical protein